ncbi:hypothetical protein DPMN_088142 [Dreissena polymorpha]|uniref:Uncharacterized protein n=1 Tax=Dreissena polymorpha TaxID=45954 RepID=A0A9D4QX17_DREPO|nr:hypothetical protein DPMN_088142 [Dreissena polymorpha]
MHSQYRYEELNTPQYELISDDDVRNDDVRTNKRSTYHRKSFRTYVPTLTEGTKSSRLPDGGRGRMRRHVGGGAPRRRMLKCYRKGKQRRPSLPTSICFNIIRSKQNRTKRPNDTKTLRSERFNSGWPSNEFDSAYALDDEFDDEDANETRKSENENI